MAPEIMRVWPWYVTSVVMARNARETLSDSRWLMIDPLTTSVSLQRRRHPGRGEAFHKHDARGLRKYKLVYTGSNILAVMIQLQAATYGGCSPNTVVIRTTRARRRGAAKERDRCVTMTSLATFTALAPPTANANMTTSERKAHENVTSAALLLVLKVAPPWPTKSSERVVGDQRGPFGKTFFIPRRRQFCGWGFEFTHAARS
jgi:hypothetical protein